MPDLSNDRLREMIGADVPCVPATGAEVATMVRELITLRSWALDGILPDDTSPAADAEITLEPEGLEAALAAFNTAINKPQMIPCPKCEGRGYYHGFGEDGASPDWCSQCGGNQFDIVPGEEQRAMSEAIRAYLSRSTLPLEGQVGVPTGWRLVPEEPTPEMLEAGMDDLGWWVEPYTAPRESGVPVECDMSAEDAAKINAQQVEVVAATYRAMIAPLSPSPAVRDGVEDVLKKALEEIAADRFVTVEGAANASLERRDIARAALRALSTQEQGNG